MNLKNTNNISKKEEQANILLIEGQNGKSGLTILSPIFTHKENGEYTETIKNILNRGIICLKSYDNVSIIIFNPNPDRESRRYNFKGCKTLENVDVIFCGRYKSNRSIVKALKY